MDRVIIVLSIIAVIILVLVGIGVFYALNDSNDSNTSSPATTTNNECVELGCNPDTLYVGSINSDKYYPCDCHYAERILLENIICFTSDNDATTKEYEKVENC